MSVKRLGDRLYGFADLYNLHVPRKFDGRYDRRSYYSYTIYYFFTSLKCNRSQYTFLLYKTLGPPETYSL